MANTPELRTERLILRRYTLEDAEAYYELMRDAEVNTFLPFFPFERLEEARTYLREKMLPAYAHPFGCHHAICLASDRRLIGYVNVADDDSHDLGYGLRKDCWHQGIVTEACRAVVDWLRTTDLPYLTATHDVQNPRSGRVMQKLGMTYRYSYEELWQPKNKWVTFRMYQLNLDGQEDRVYRKYWDKYPKHWVEEGI